MWVLQNYILHLANKQEKDLEEMAKRLKQPCT